MTRAQSNIARITAIVFLLAGLERILSRGSSAVVLVLLGAGVALLLYGFGKRDSPAEKE